MGLMNNDLLPCPFCDEPEEIKLITPKETGISDIFWVMCISCGARACEGVSAQIARENWNRLGDYPILQLKLQRQ